MSKKLLLADDSITIQKVVNLTFADEGIEVVTAGDGDAAMKRFVESQPDLVMADVNMPGMDGYKICEMIKEDDETKDIPVILLVGSFEPFDEEEARRVGADDYLTKPFQSIRQLVNKVSALLGTSNGQESAFSEKITQETPQQFFDSYANEITDADLGDAGMDDEMIQASQNIDSAADEMQYSESNFDEEPEDDWTKTESLAAEESDEIYSAASEADTAPLDGNIVSFTDEQNFSEESAENETNNQNSSEQMATEEIREKSEDDAATLNNSDFSPNLNFDEFDLLELPGISTSFESQTEIISPSFAENEKLNDVEETDERIGQMNNSKQEMSFPPELIEAVADRVAEKISDKAVSEIMQRLAPQMVDLIKRMAEEKKKD